MQKVERSITDEVIDLLGSIPDSFVFKTHGNSFQRSGMPDLYFTCRALNGRSVWIEMKRPGGGFRKLQSWKVSCLRRAGCLCLLASSVADVERLIDYFNLRRVVV